MIVRTYKRRSRGELLGSQGSTGDGDEELGFPGGPRTFAADKFCHSQEDRYGEPDSPRWSPFQQDRHSFSLPSSSSSRVDDVDIFQFSSEPIQRPQLPEELGKSSRTLIPTAPDSLNVNAKCGRSISAGQKLIRAESLLKKAKTGSSISVKASREFGLKRTSGHVNSTSGDDQVQARLMNCAIERGNSKAVATDVVNGSVGQATEKNTFAAETSYMVARATSSHEGDEMKAMAVSAQISSILGPCAPPTSTLLEAQESGEMMEHVDEANFAMDGLRPGQPLRICRASLISLLSIFGSRQRRRLLRTHGMVKPVLDAVLTVPTDDPATALGAAALLYFIAYDGQDEDFVDSPECIQFLMKLLDPVCRSVHDKRLSRLGSRLLALGTNSKSNKVEAHLTVLDQGGLLLVNKVKHLLSTMKGRSDGTLKLDDQSASFPAEVLSSEWLVLLTLEKACLSTVVLEENAGSVRRVGGCFKERLREHGGLNVVCELAASCFFTLRKIKSKMDYQQQITLINGSRGAGVLLRCLRVMENVTFLSENNQKFLLDMILSNNGAESPNTFLEVVIGTINMISGFILSRICMESTSHGVQAQKSPEVQAFNLLDRVSFQSGGKVSGPAGNDKSTLLGLSLEGCKVKGSFDFDDLDCSEKDLGCNQVLKKRKGQISTKRETCEPTSAQMISSEHIDTNLRARESHDNLLEDCLLSAVKVLMNLTNDNDLGCRQVAVVGGLDALASLIVKHFPSFQSFPSNVEKRNRDRKANEKFTKDIQAEYQDQDLDLLVVVLGVLVNLVEKDTRNRGRLVSLNTEGFYDTSNGSVTPREHSIIKLLCLIFLSKQGSGRAAESSKANPAREIDDEKSFKQGQQEAEDMILEAYSALLLAFLSKESSTVRSTIAEHLPEGNLSVLVPVLERFLDFHLSLNMLSSETHETVRDVIESCK
eukprot:c18835_g1_i1 orf=139-2943(+)